MRIDDMFSGDNSQNELDSEIDKEIEEVELMGYELEDPELLGKIFGRLFRRIGKGIAKRRRGKKGLIKRIVSRIKRKKRAKAKRGGASSDDYGLSLRTPGGTARIGPEGISYTDKVRMMKAGMLPQTAEKDGGIMEMVQKNPMLLAIPAGLLLMIMMKKKQRPAYIPIPAAK